MEDEPKLMTAPQSHQFPRVVVEMEPEDLELSEECLRDAMRVTDAAGKERFYRRYGSSLAPQSVCVEKKEGRGNHVVADMTGKKKGPFSSPSSRSGGSCRAAAR